MHLLIVRYCISPLMLWATDIQGLSNIQQSQSHQVLKFQRPCRQMLLEPGEVKKRKHQSPEPWNGISNLRMEKEWSHEIEYPSFANCHEWKMKCHTVAYLFDVIVFPSSSNNHLHLEHIALAHAWRNQIFQDITLIQPVMQLKIHIKELSKGHY